MNGFLNIDKPAGWTSHDVVAKLRRVLGVKKVGHTGTLDPAATGVLPICVGKATKVAQFLLEMDKQYRVIMRLGGVTDTQDATGTLLEQKPVDRVSHEEIRKTVEGFQGPVTQLVPMYSAVKVGGQPLYKAARQKKIVDRPSRRVMIYRINLLNIEDRRDGGIIDVTFDITSSKGTYIRTLCADMGEKLGVGAHLLRLERRCSGPFEIGEAMPIEEVQRTVSTGKIKEKLIPIHQALSRFSSLRVNSKVSDRIIHGGKISTGEFTSAPAQFETGETILVYNASNELVALASALMSSKRVAEVHSGGEVFKIRKVLV